MTLRPYFTSRNLFICIFYFLSRFANYRGSLFGRYKRICFVPQSVRKHRILWFIIDGKFLLIPRQFESSFGKYCQTPVDFTFAWDNNVNNNDNNNNNKNKNPHLSFLKMNSMDKGKWLREASKLEHSSKLVIRNMAKGLSGVSHWRPNLVSIER